MKMRQALKCHLATLGFVQNDRALFQKAIQLCKAPILFLIDDWFGNRSLFTHD